MDTLRLEGTGKVIDLYPWLNLKTKGHEALAGIVGFGLPDAENQWFEGAGSGSTWRGTRTPRRRMGIPLRVYAANRSELWELLSDLSVALDPYTGDVYEHGPARLYFGGPDEHEWYIDVARSGGGDWARKVDSDDRKFFQTTLGLEAGDAFWTRNEPEDFVVEQATGVNTLLPRIAKQRVSSSAVFGERGVVNSGDTFAWPVIRLNGPSSGVTLIGPKGEIVDWTGTVGLNHWVDFDMRNSIVEDDLGVNRYDGLAAAPQFWSIAPGESVVSVEASDITPDSSVYAQWWPRRWAVV